jgi:hypothetical protein
MNLKHSTTIPSVSRLSAVAMQPKHRAHLARPTAALLFIVTISIIQLCSCIDPRVLEPAQAVSETDSWLKAQGDCSQFYASRRFIKGEEVALLSAGAPDTSSSSSQAAGITAKGEHDNSSWCPALLWTYTGTGNTMTRMLIEAVSGWYTGSVYTGMHNALGRA